MTRRAVTAAVLALSGLAAAGCGAAANGASRVPVFSPASPDSASAPESSPAAATAGTAAAPAAESAAKPLAGKVVVIDPGHNGGNYRHPEVINKQVDVLTKHKECDTTGTATNSGYSEAAFNWDVSQRLAKLLKARGATVKLTRHGNGGVGPCVTERAAIGNKAEADAAISVHADGSGAANHGFHVIMPKKIGGPVDPVVGKSRSLGIAVRDAMKKGTGLAYSTYIGSKALDYRDDLGGLNLTTVPKIFVECGNMRNAAEAAKFRSAAFRQKIALALANGMQHYLT